MGKKSVSVHGGRAWRFVMVFYRICSSHCIGKLFYSLCIKGLLVEIPKLFSLLNMAL